jgi:hypothetical protein
MFYLLLESISIPLDLTKFNVHYTYTCYLPPKAFATYIATYITQQYDIDPSVTFDFTTTTASTRKWSWRISYTLLRVPQYHGSRLISYRIQVDYLK